MNNMRVKAEDIIAYKLITKRFIDKEREYDELCDSLFHYMQVYIIGSFDVILFADEVENLIGIRKHREIVDYIIKNYK